MKRIILVVSCLILYSLPALAQTATDYYPFEVGNYWVHKNTESDGTSRTKKTEIECFEEFQGKMAYRLKSTTLDDNNPATSSYAWYQIEDGYLNMIAVGISPTMVIYDWDPPLKVLSSDAGTVGVSWTNKLEQQNDDYPGVTIISLWQDSVISNSETVTVPAGSFDNCIKMHTTVESSIDEPHPDRYRYYAPHIGEVLSVSEEPDGTSTRHELIEYSVGRN